MAVVVLSGGLTLCAMIGCGTRTTKTTQTVTSEERVRAVDTDEEQQIEPATTTVTTTTTERDAGSPGIVSSAFLFVWAVVTFPFRVISAIF